MRLPNRLKPPINSASALLPMRTTIGLVSSNAKALMGKSLARAELSIQGFGYTQFTDVAQEINGFADIKRTLKVPVEKLREIFG